MLKLKLAAASAAVALLGVMTASAAQAEYEDVAIALVIDNPTVVGGNPISGTATSNGPSCEWTISYRGATRTGSGDSIDFTFETPEVDKKTKNKLTAKCIYDDGFAESASFGDSAAVEPAVFHSSAGAILPAVDQTLTRSATITLLPEAGPGVGGDDDALPDTGGLDSGLLILGGALVAGGAGAIFLARRRGNA